MGLFGVLDYINGRVFCDTAEQLNTQEFEKFMNEKVLPAYPDKHIYMILDNSKIHHAHSLDKFKKDNENKITFIFLPPYSPNLNRIEGLWKWLKETVVYNNFFKNTFEIKRAVVNFLCSIKYEVNKIKKRLCF